MKTARKGLYVPITKKEEEIIMELRDRYSVNISGLVRRLLEEHLDTIKKSHQQVGQ